MLKISNKIITRELLYVLGIEKILSDIVGTGVPDCPKNHKNGY